MTDAQVNFAQEYECPDCGRIVIVRGYSVDNEYDRCPNCGDEIPSTTAPREVKLAAQEPSPRSTTRRSP